MATKKMLTRLFGTRTSPKLLPPRMFPTTGFKVLDPAVSIEEETIPDYKPELFYPVRIGEVFQDRFQVVGKLGYGSRSTVWLCHDLRSDRPVLFCLGNEPLLIVLFDTVIGDMQRSRYKSTF